MIVAPRKNGKTAILAALSLYRLLTSEGRPEILLAAPSDKVAGRLFDACARFVRRSPELSKLLGFATTPARSSARTAWASSTGCRPTRSGCTATTRRTWSCDELAHRGRPRTCGVLTPPSRRAAVRASAPQVFTITTAGEAIYRHDSILGSILDAAADADDVDREPGLTVSRMPDARTLVWEYAAPTTDPHDIDGDEAREPGIVDHRGVPAPAGREPRADRRPGAAAPRLRLGRVLEHLDRPGPVGSTRRRAHHPSRSEDRDWLRRIGPP